MQDGNYSINPEILREALREKGFSSFAELSRKLGLHRNTLGKYLAGAPVLPRSLELVFSELGLSAAEILEDKRIAVNVPALAIGGLIGELSIKYPSLAFVLFGSRARGKHKNFSDYDIGIYSSKQISFAQYSKMLDAVGEWNDNNLSSVDLVNLTQADADFLLKIRKDLRFLSGNVQEWISLLKQCGCKVYEK